MNKSITCINCPAGCVMDVWVDCDGRVGAVTGNACARGLKYAADEITNPLRMVTTTVRLRGGAAAMLPVKTSRPVAKAVAERVAASLRDVSVDAPVAAGDVVVRDVCGTAADIVATRSL